MGDLYEHELSSYKREIEEWDKALRSGLKQDPTFNLTHFSLGLSNRANLIIIGLCSLVEIRLYKIAEEREKQSTIKIKDSKGNGLSRLKNFLSQTKAINFGKLTSWPSFRHVYTIRNALVHTYGGVVVSSSDLLKVKKATEALGIKQVLSTSRIRFETNSLWKAHKVVSKLIEEIKDQDT